MSQDLRNNKGTRYSDAELDMLYAILQKENTSRRDPLAIASLIRMLTLEAAEARGFKPEEFDKTAPREPEHAVAGAKRKHSR